MRLLRLLVAIACLAAGAIIGALNRAPVLVDLGFARLPSNLGVALIVALLLGVLVGGLAISASVVLPLRRRLALAQRQIPSNISVPASSDPYSTASPGA